MDSIKQPSSMPSRKRDDNGIAYVMMGLFIVFFIFIGKNSDSVGSYVPAHHTRTGHMVRGHIRKTVSTSPHALRQRNASKNYRYRHPGRYSHH